MGVLLVWRPSEDVATPWPIRPGWSWVDDLWTAMDARGHSCSHCLTRGHHRKIVIVVTTVPWIHRWTHVAIMLLPLLTCEILLLGFRRRSSCCRHVLSSSGLERLSLWILWLMCLVVHLSWATVHSLLLIVISWGRHWRVASVLLRHLRWHGHSLVLWRLVLFLILHSLATFGVVVAFPTVELAL